MSETIIRRLFWVAYGVYIFSQYLGNCMVSQEFSEYSYSHSQWNYFETHLRLYVCLTYATNWNSLGKHHVTRSRMRINSIAIDVDTIASLFSPGQFLYSAP